MRITTYYQLHGNDPPSVVTRSSGFVSQFAFVTGDGKTIIVPLVSEIYFNKSCIRAIGIKSYPRETIIVNETKNICRELNSSIEAIGLSIDKIDVFLDPRTNLNFETCAYGL